jgi:hypothetical protein
MPKLTPKQADKLSRDTGLEFTAVRRSKLAPQLLELRNLLKDAELRVKALSARARAFKVARRYERSPSERIELRLLERSARTQLAAARSRCFNLRRELESVKSRLAAQAVLAYESAEAVRVARLERKTSGSHDTNDELGNDQ